MDAVLFFREMVAYFKKVYGVNTERIFAVGYSNGGQMAFKLAFEAADLFKGIAAFSANIPIAENSDCQVSTKAISTLIINGTADRLNPYKGGLVGTTADSSRGRVMSTHESINYLRSFSKKESLVKIKTFADINTKDLSIVVQYDWKLDRSQIRLLEIKGGGHNIPLLKKPFILPGLLGAVNQDINAPLEVINFFEEL